MDAASMKYVAVAFTVFGMVATAFSIGNMMSAAMTGISRNPGSADKMSTLLYVGLALAEAMGLLSLVLGFVVLLMA